MSKRLPDVAGYQWIMTAANPRSSSRGYDAGRRGWRMHAVKATPETKFQEVRHDPAVCGLYAAHGWDLDMFAEDRACARCLLVLGLACHTCRGTGYRREKGQLRHKGQWCGECFGRGFVAGE